MVKISNIRTYIAKYSTARRKLDRCSHPKDLQYTCWKLAPIGAGDRLNTRNAISVITLIVLLGMVGRLTKFRDGWVS